MVTSVERNVLSLEGRISNGRVHPPKVLFFMIPT